MALSIGMLHSSIRPDAAASQIDIPGPAGSGAFGTSVTVLPNGNIVVTDPYYNGGIGVEAGAAYLYDGAMGAQISTIAGSAANDRVGAGGVVVLRDGDYVVRSVYWGNGGLVDAGAVTWGSGTGVVKGVISAANSLVGSTSGDRVSSGILAALSNGNYVVSSPGWDSGGVVGVGAVTWGIGAGQPGIRRPSEPVL